MQNILRSPQERKEKNQLMKEDKTKHQEEANQTLKNRRKLKKIIRNTKY